jgi:hypothetical protein
MSAFLCGQGTAKMKQNCISCFINAPNHENIFFFKPGIRKIKQFYPAKLMYM